MTTTPERSPHPLDAVFAPLSPEDQAEAATLGSLLSAPGLALWLEAEGLEETSPRRAALEVASRAELVLTPVRLPGVQGQLEIYRISAEDPYLVARLPQNVYWVCAPGRAARVLPAALAARKWAIEQAAETALSDLGGGGGGSPCERCGAEDAEGDWVLVEVCGPCYRVLTSGDAPILPFGDGNASGEKAPGDAALPDGDPEEAPPQIRG